MSGRHIRSESFRVLIVCTANECRSPMAEYLLRQALTARWGAAPAASWTIESAGLQARPGREMNRHAQTVLAEHDITATGFRSRLMTTDLAQNADLILTATREHRAQVVQLNPRVLARVFTMNQFGHLLTAVPLFPPATTEEAGHWLIEAARQARSQVPARTIEDDLADPIGKSVAHFRACARILQDDVTAILRPVDPTVLEPEL